MNTKKQSDKLAIGALSATIVALLSYFMDLVSTSFFRFSGFKFLSEAFGYLTFSSIIFIIAFAATAGSIITAFLAMKNPDFRRITMIVSAVALGAMLYFAIDSEIFDYAGFGFWLFFLSATSALSV